MTVLLVDDDPAVLRSAGGLLRLSGYGTILCSSPEHARNELCNRYIDVMAIEIVLGSTNGLEVVKAIRQDGNAVPIIVFTGSTCRDLACNEAFQAGANDFVAKPLSSEFLARVARLIPRKRVSGPMHAPPGERALRLEVGRLRVLDRQRSIELRDADGIWREVELTRSEHDLLSALLGRIGQVVPIQQLLDDVWGTASAVSPHALEALVSRLRKKLGPARGMLVTAARQGYRLGPAKARVIGVVERRPA